MQKNVGGSAEHCRVLQVDILRTAVPTCEGAHPVVDVDRRKSGRGPKAKTVVVRVCAFASSPTYSTFTYTVCGYPIAIIFTRERATFYSTTSTAELCESSKNISTTCTSNTV